MFEVRECAPRAGPQDGGVDMPVKGGVGRGSTPGECMARACRLCTAGELCAVDDTIGSIRAAEQAEDADDPLGE